MTGINNSTSRPSTDTNNPEVAKATGIDDLTSPKASTTNSSFRWGRGRGRVRGRSGGAGGTRGTHGGHGSVGEGVKRKADGDASVPGPNLKKARTAPGIPPPREMSKRCAINTWIFILTRR